MTKPLSSCEAACGNLCSPRGMKRMPPFPDYVIAGVGPLRHCLALPGGEAVQHAEAAVPPLSDLKQAGRDDEPVPAQNPRHLNS